MTTQPSPYPASGRFPHQCPSTKGLSPDSDPSEVDLPAEALDLHQPERPAEALYNQGIDLKKSGRLTEAAASFGRAAAAFGLGDRGGAGWELGRGFANRRARWFGRSRCH